MTNFVFLFVSLAITFTMVGAQSPKEEPYTFIPPHMVKTLHSGLYRETARKGLPYNFELHHQDEQGRITYANISAKHAKHVIFVSNVTIQCFTDGLTVPGNAVERKIRVGDIFFADERVCGNTEHQYLLRKVKSVVFRKGEYIIETTNVENPMEMLEDFGIQSYSEHSWPGSMHAMPANHSIHEQRRQNLPEHIQDLYIRRTWPEWLRHFANEAENWRHSVQNMVHSSHPKIFGELESVFVESGHENFTKRDMPINIDIDNSDYTNSVNDNDVQESLEAPRDLEQDEIDTKLAQHKKALSAWIRKARNAINDVKNWVRKVANKAREYANLARQWAVKIANAVKSKVNSAINAVKRAWNKVKAGLVKAWNKVKAGLAKAWNKFKEMWAKLKKWLSFVKKIWALKDKLANFKFQPKILPEAEYSFYVDPEFICQQVKSLATKAQNKYKQRKLKNGKQQKKVNKSPPADESDSGLTKGYNIDCPILLTKTGVSVKPNIVLLLQLRNFKLDQWQVSIGGEVQIDLMMTLQFNANIDVEKVWKSFELKGLRIPIPPISSSIEIFPGLFPSTTFRGYARVQTNEFGLRIDSEIAFGLKGSRSQPFSLVKKFTKKITKVMPEIVKAEGGVQAGLILRTEVRINFVVFEVLRIELVKFGVNFNNYLEAPFKKTCVAVGWRMKSLVDVKFHMNFNLGPFSNIFSFNIYTVTPKKLFEVRKTFFGVCFKNGRFTKWPNSQSNPEFSRLAKYFDGTAMLKNVQSNTLAESRQVKAQEQKKQRKFKKDPIRKNVDQANSEEAKEKKKETSELQEGRKVKGQVKAAQSKNLPDTRIKGKPRV